MTDVEVYILSNDDCNAIYAINATNSRGPHIIVCDYGSGPCTEETDINNATYSEWKTDLESIVPFSSRSTVTVTITDDI